MSRETEKVFKEMHKFLNEHATEDMDEKELDELCRKFMDEYNDNLPGPLTEKTAKTADDFLELAYDAEDEKVALKHVKKALKLDPDNLDAAMFKIDLECLGQIERLEKLEVLAKAGDHLMNEKGYMTDEDIGHFWGILATRPYMRVRRRYADELLMCGMLRKGIAEFEDMLRLCDSDNLGNRFILMHLYAYFEEDEKALALYKHYQGDHEPQMMLPLSILYFKKGDLKAAAKYLKKLAAVNEDTAEFVGAVLSGAIDDIYEEMSGFGYRPRTIEELVTAYMDNELLYDGSLAYFIWAFDQMEKMNSKAQASR